MFIYKLTNIKNNKIYIGLTTEKSVAERCRKRVAEAKFRLSRNSYILNAIRKYGAECFVSEVIDTAESLEELKFKEMYYIELFNSLDKNIGYNLTKGGDGRFGYKLSDETKDKIRKRAIGRKASNEARIKMSLSSKLRDKTIAIANCMAYNESKKKPVLQFTKNGEFVKEFSYVGEVVKEMNIDRSGISAYLNSDKFQKGKTYKGYLYKFN